MIPNKIVLHCSDTPNGKHVSIDAMREDHIARGFGGVAYHIFIQPDGEAIITRPFNEKGYHVSKHNEGSIGICLAGKDKFTQRQFDALRYKLDSIFLTYNIKKTELFVHAQFDTAIKQGKTCPNIRINDLLLWYYNTVGEQAIANYIYKES